MEDVIMKIDFKPEALAKIQPHLGDGKKLLLTFEDGVGPYSQHAMIHMQIQFSFNVVAADADVSDYQTWLDSNLGKVGIKDYSAEDLDENMVVRLNESSDSLVLSGDGGIIDINLGFIDFTDPNGIAKNPAR